MTEDEIQDILKNIDAPSGSIYRVYQDRREVEICKPPYDISDIETVRF